MRRHMGIAVLAVVLAGTGCSHASTPVAAPAPSASTPAPTYDPTLEASAAVLAIVPSNVTALAVTDDAEIRLDLGFSTLTSQSSAAQRAAAAQQERARSAQLTAGLLRPVDAELRSQYGFGQDDVDWEAQFVGPSGVGYAIKLRDGVATAGPQAAVTKGVGPLAGATYYPSAQVLLKNGTLNTRASLAADPAVTELMGAVAQSTFLLRSCLSFESIFGKDVRSQLVPAVSSEVGDLEPLSAFSVSLGSELATVQLGPGRADAFVRARLPDHLPRTSPDLGLAFADPLADPRGGRIGYSIVDPALAAQLTLARKLPFALCSDSSAP